MLLTGHLVSEESEDDHYELQSCSLVPNNCNLTGCRGNMWAGAPRATIG